MYKVTESVDFCYGHRLLRYQGKCAHLHGHNGKVEIELASGALNDQSMVIDFSDIVRIVKGFIDQNLDHRLLLHREDPLVPVLRAHDEPVFLMDSDPTAEAIARLIYDYADSQGLKVSQVRLWETGTSVASYAPATR
ncbi:MAG TPA: 6-carboxytetrahydropterin synthase [Candidatus Polarisedimenticolia bacterium]|nr:6-carboxytetrahydropterin synthase [Candidatus Polarisedimenticolia bacterium]